MDFIARKYVFIPGNKILASEWSAELDQLYRYLSGTLSGQLHLKQNTANSVLILQNTTVGKDIILFKQNGLDKVRILETQQLKSEISGVAPIDVVSTTVVTKLNAQYLDGLPESNFIPINVFHTEYLVPLVLVDVQATSVKHYVYLVPAGTNMTMTSIEIFGIGYVGDTDGVVTVSVRQNGVAKLNGSLSPGSSLSSGAISIALAENDILSLTADAIDVFPGLHFVHATIKVRQDLNS